MAKVIFSDGSKADAHNLDDLRERWILRKQEEAELLGTGFLRPIEPDYQKPTSLDQAVEWRSILKDICGRLQAKLTALNAIRPRQKNWRVQRAAIVAELEYRRAQIRLMKPIIKTFADKEEHERNAEKIANTPEFVQELMIEIHRCKTVIRDLKQRLALYEDPATCNDEAEVY